MEALIKKLMKFVYIVMSIFLIQEVYNSFIINHAPVWLKLFTGILSGMLLVFTISGLIMLFKDSHDYVAKERLLKAGIIFHPFLWVFVCIHTIIGYDNWDITFTFYDLTIFGMFQGVIYFRYKSIQYLRKLIAGGDSDWII